MRSALWSLLFGFCVAVHAQDRPPWFDRVQFFQNTNGYLLYPDPSVSAAPFTGEPWGVFFPNYWVTNTLLTGELAAWRSHQGLYMVSTNIATAYDASLSQLDSARMVDLSGQIITHSIISSPLYTLSSPLWRGVLQKVVTDAVDFGVDGVHIDDVTEPSNLVFSYNQQSGSFDSLTMSEFRTYLRATYTDDVLKTKFNIPDPPSFDYGAWIKANHSEANWNATPFQGLAAEFYAFRILETKHFVHDLVAHAHEYGQLRLGHPFTISGNTAFDVNSYYLLDELDYFVNESFTFGFDPTFPKPFANVDIKTFKGIKNWPVVVMPEPWKAALPKTSTNMIRLALADIYASGGVVSFGNAFTQWSAEKRIGIDYSVLQRYADFILRHRDLYEALHFEPHVALLSSMASRTAFVWPCEGGCGNEYGSFGAALDYYGVAQLLIDTNTQFDVLFAPDSRFSHLPALTLDRLQKYKALVVPDTFALDDSQASILMDYVRRGGVVIATGDIGTHMPGGVRVNRPDLTQLQQVEGDRRLGDGHFLYSRGLLGAEYLTDATKDPVSLRRTFAGLLSPYAQPEVRALSVSEVYRYGGATAFMYRQLGGDYVVHLVNYDYNELTDQFAVKNNLSLNIQMETKASPQALLRSPDAPDQVLDAFRGPEGVSITIPVLEAYDVLVLHPLDHCQTGGSTLCLQGSRFEVRVDWGVPADGTSGHGAPVSLTGDTGYFWFFSSNNVELVVKIVDGRPVNGKFWVFFGALSNVEYDIHVFDTETGVSKTYHNDSGVLASVADTSAF